MSQNQGGGGGGGGPPKTKMIAGAAWIYLAQFFVMAVNIVLNWVPMWFFFRPTDQSSLFWQNNWMLSTAVLAIFLQVIFTWGPMFITPNAFYGKWRDYLTWGDELMNYVAFYIILVEVVGIGVQLRILVISISEAIDSLIRTFGAVINLETLMTLIFIFILSKVLHALSIVFELVQKRVPVSKQPPTQQPAQKSGGGQ